jgi:DNA-binding LytR/AlgR family response regulator
MGVGECRNGSEAIAAIRQSSPDLVFLDVQMPGLSGFDVIRQVGAERMPLVIFVVNVARVRELKPQPNNEYIVMLRSGIEVRASRSYAERLRAVIGQPLSTAPIT